MVGERESPLAPGAVYPESLPHGERPDLDPSDPSWVECSSFCRNDECPYVRPDGSHYCCQCAGDFDHVPDESRVPVLDGGRSW